MKFGIIGNLDKSGLTEAVALLVTKLDRSKMQYIVEEGIARLLGEGRQSFTSKQIGKREDCVRNVDMVVALGGDGTMLSAARLVGTSGTPILGVNLGKLGFLAEVAPGELQEALGEIIGGKYKIEKRLVLEATVSQLPGKVMHGLNDLVVDKSRSSRLIDVEVYINDAFAVSYRADGLIISTPTGSTAYALSSGGPIVVPTSNVIGITPISPHTLSGRPLVIPDTDTIRIVTKDPAYELLVSVDGQEEAVLKPPVEVRIRRASHTVNLVKRASGSYYDVLRAKLLWGKDARGT
jgi:NAD+ kinase